MGFFSKLLGLDNPSEGLDRDTRKASRRAVDVINREGLPLLAESAAGIRQGIRDGGDLDGGLGLALQLADINRGGQLAQSSVEGNLARQNLLGLGLSQALISGMGQGVGVARNRARAQDRAFNAQNLLKLYGMAPDFSTNPLLQFSGQ